MALLILAIAVILLGIYVSESLPKSPVNSTDVALNVALSDPGVKQANSQFDNHYTASFRQIDASSTKGFINYSGQLVGVYIQSTPPRGPPPLVNFYFIIDTNRSRIMDRSSWLDIPPYDDVTIPPGSAWYHEVASTGHGFGGTDGTPWTSLKSSYTPADANVSQFIVSEEGLHRLMNLSPVTSLPDIDVSKYVTVYNRSETQGPEWNATIRWPAVEVIQGPGTGMSSEPWYRPDDNYYIVVINRESSRDVSLSQWAMTGSTM